VTPDPAEHAWWLASRSAGVVALLCITVSVGVGLAMAGRLSPRAGRALLDVHQWTALVGLVAIAVHGITLLGDRFLAPSIGDIALLAAALGVSVVALARAEQSEAAVTKRGVG